MILEAPVLEIASCRFHIDMERQGGDFRIELHGDVDVQEALALDVALSVAERSDDECVVLDLTALRYIGSAGLRSILAAHHRLDDGRALLLERGCGNVQRLFEVSGVESLLYFLD